MRRARGAAAALLCGAAAAVALAVEPAVELFLAPRTSFWQHLEAGDFSGPRGVAYDRARGEVWVADTGGHRLGLFTPDGLPVYSVRPGGNVREPSRIAIEPDGGLLLLDGDRTRIARLDWRGRYVGDLELPGLPERPSFGAIELDAEGNLWVGENVACEVVVYGPDRRVRNRFGRCGSGLGEFRSIADIAVDAEIVVVVDHQVLAVQIFDRRGNALRGFGEHQMGLENFSLPEAVAFDSRGNLVVVDALRHEIKRFARDGRFLGRSGGYGGAPGQVAAPVDVASDGAGLLFVAERVGARVQVFEERERTVPPERRRPARRRRESP